MRFVFDGNSIELYLGKFRLELWVRVTESMSGVSVHILPALVLRGSADFIGAILHLDWLIFQIGISVRWIRDGEEV